MGRRGFLLTLLAGVLGGAPKPKEPVRRLWYVKHGGRGPLVLRGSRTFLPQGKVISGQVMKLPSVTDKTGEYIWDYAAPRA